MSPQDKLHREIRTLLLAATAGEAGQEEWHRLNSLLQTDESARDYAMLIMHQISAMEWSASDALAQVQCKFQGEYAFDLEGLVRVPRSNWRRSAIQWLAPLAAMLLIGGFATMWWLRSDRDVGHDRDRALVAMQTPHLEQGDATLFEAAAPEAAVTVIVGEWVARLTQSTPDATWGEGSGPTDFLLRLRPGQTVELLTGHAELEFVSGAVVILHGPTVLTATGPDNAMLKLGRVTGRAENGNFFLETPTARVVDLGTEFGVVVDDADNTDVLVFEGEVSVAPRDMLKKRVEAIFLDGGATARIDARGELATGISLEWEAFKRVIPREPPTAEEAINENWLSLIDIFNGGDGRGRILAGAIDPISGGWDQRPWQYEHGPGRLGSGQQYRLAINHQLIDGVFVPSDEGKNTQINSRGDRIDFPPSLGATWGPIWARRRGDGELPLVSQDFWGTGTLPFIVRRIEAAHVGALGMHPNVGLTFDLHKTSEVYRGRFQRLEATLVNLDLAEETDPDGLRRAPERTADFWVFVDGELKYSRLNFGRDLEGEFFQVELSPKDRFLTLVSTDGGNSISFDHVMLIDPVLTLVEKDGQKGAGRE